MNWYLTWGKRSADFVFALIISILLSPVIIIVAILVLIKLGRPILFTQQRPGINGHIFTLFKFRSMNSKLSKDGEPLPDADRLSNFGKLLRSSSLDELPGLWNILRGDMSFVGPRPLRVEYLPLYSPEQSKRHNVLPGLTGLAQVSGRNALDWPTRLRYDVEYVENISVGKDIWIIWKTVGTVLNRTGITSETHATMEPFKGEQ